LKVDLIGRPSESGIRFTYILFKEIDLISLLLNKGHNFAIATEIVGAVHGIDHHFFDLFNNRRNVILEELKRNRAQHFRDESRISIGHKEETISTAKL